MCSAAGQRFVVVVYNNCLYEKIQLIVSLSIICIRNYLKTLEHEIYLLLTHNCYFYAQLFLSEKLLKLFLEVSKMTYPFFVLILIAPYIQGVTELNIA